MSLHQIIHTSRKCGLYGGEPGFGVLSSDRDFPRHNEFGDKLYEYKAPELENPSPEYSERLIACMPVSYTYRYSGGSCAITRSACLGKDPFGSGMNHISHSILFNDTDSAAYPCEYIDSPSFLSAPGADAINAETGVSYVGAPVLSTGTSVTVNKVMKFLSHPDNFRVFRNMLWALIHKEETKRRIVICDEQENTVLWIAALNYALPLSYAKKISYSTYSYDPRHADVDICGSVSNCTAYGGDLHEDENFFVFDLTSGECFDPGAYAEDEEFFAFISETMQHNYETLKVFHTYVELFCDTERVTPAIVPAYHMSRASNCYAMNSADAFRSVTEAEFDRIAEYSGRHARYGGKLMLFEAMLSVSEAVLGFAPSYLIKVLKYMSAVYPDASYILKNGFRALAVDSVPIVMITRDMTSSAFSGYYEQVRELTADCGIDITDELMTEKSRQALLFVSGYQSVEWKPDFIVSLISEYVHKHGSSYECLSPSDKIGGFLSAVMKNRYECGTDKAASDHALSLFTDDVKRFCTVEENLESVTDTVKDGMSASVNLVTAFSEQAAAHMEDRRTELFDFLAAAEKYDLMWSVLSQMISTYETRKTSDLINEHYTNYFTASSDYAQRYLPTALEEYYANFKRKKPESVKEAQELVFGILLNERLTISISDEIADGMISRMRFSKPTKETEKQINDVGEYECNIRGKELSGKLLCLVFGVCVAGINNRKDYHNRKAQFSSLTAREQIDLTRFSDAESDAYLNWILEPFSEHVEPEEIPFVYGLFRFNTPQSSKFTQVFCDEMLDQAKHQSDYSEFCVFLRFVFTTLGADELQEVADKVNRLNSKKLDQLKQDAESAFSQDFALKEKFEYLLSIQPKRRGLFSFFKR